MLVLPWLTVSQPYRGWGGLVVQVAGAALVPAVDSAAVEIAGPSMLLLTVLYCHGLQPTAQQILEEWAVAPPFAGLVLQSAVVAAAFDDAEVAAAFDDAEIAAAFDGAESAAAFDGAEIAAAFDGAESAAAFDGAVVAAAFDDAEVAVTVRGA